jgi:hypothetical protein
MIGGATSAAVPVTKAWWSISIRRISFIKILTDEKISSCNITKASSFISETKAAISLKLCSVSEQKMVNKEKES